MVPMMRTASPGPGNGWRQTMSSGRPSSSPTARTSSLNRCRNGSTSSKSMSSGRPPTLWCDLMLALSPPPDSTMSGYSVPCTRKRGSTPFSARSRAASSNTRMNVSPMILRLRFGVDDVVERADEAVGRLHVHELDVELAPEGRLHLLALVEAHQARVDEHARELVADRLVHERGGDRRVDTTRQRAQHTLVAHLRADLSDRLLDDRRVGPRGAASAHVEQEPLHQILPALRVRDLGVELHPVHRSGGVLERGDRRARRRGGHREPRAARRRSRRRGSSRPTARREGRRRATMARRRAGESRAAVLTAARLAHLAAELLGDELRAVTDPEHRHVGVVHRRRRWWARPRRTPTTGHPRR